MKTNTNTNKEFAKCLLAVNRTGSNKTPAVVKEPMRQALERAIEDHMQKVDELVCFISACEAIDAAKRRMAETFGSKYANQDAFPNKVELCGRRYQLHSMLKEIHNQDTAAFGLFQADYTKEVRQFDIDSDFENRASKYLKTLEECLKQYDQQD